MDQDAQRSSPAFDIAIIKPVQQDDYKGHGFYVYPGGHVHAMQSTLKMLLAVAFNIKDFQIVGGPRWAEDSLYDVEAWPPESAQSHRSAPPFISSPPSEEQRQMLQSLLTERFGVRTHWTTRSSMVYLLQKGKSPLQMHEPKHKDWMPMLTIGGGGYGGMSGQTVTMPFVASRLSVYLEHPVIDQTGLNGAFDFALPPPLGDSKQQTHEDFINGIFASMQQAGLRIKSSRAPVPMLSIDEATRPTPN